MGNVTEESKVRENEEGEGVISRVKNSLPGQGTKKAVDRQLLLSDILIFAIGFVLARCHVVFGARPLGLAFVSVLPTGVWSALFGAVIGSLSLGADGIPLAIAAAVAALLRIAASGKGKPVFSESITARMAISVICGFVVAAYEIITVGLSDESLLLLLSMIALPPLLTFVFSGVFMNGMTPYELLSRSKFPLFGSRFGEARYGRLLFGGSAVALLFFINLSLDGVVLSGISLSFIFSALVTLFVTKIFGTVVGVIVGFLITLGVAGAYSVSFALLGLGAGVMFGFGNGYAVIMGGIALSSWSIYYAGLSGFLTTLPEYLIAAALGMPFLGKVSALEDVPPDDEAVKKAAEDMVGTMALAYQNKYSDSVDRLEDTFAALSELMSNYTSRPSELAVEDYRDIVLEVAEHFCNDCSGRSLCTAEGIHPVITNADAIAKKLFDKKRITQADVNTDTEFCQIARIVAESINREISRIEQECYKRSDCTDTAVEYGLLSELIRCARERDGEERTVDSSLNGKLDEVVAKHKLSGGVMRAFGKRRRYVVLACEDADGKKITSASIRNSIESALGIKLGEPRFYRRGKMALMECKAIPRFSASCFTVSRAGLEDEVSGDTALYFESEDNKFYSLISDGMGSGGLAKETSELTAEYIKRALNYGARGETMLQLVNRVLRSRGNECSATVDLFELDRLTGETAFLKCGAAPSYVKRGDSVFRIKSQTAPIGLMKVVDAERIGVDVEDGDYVIMISDGVSDASEDAPWLLSLLCREPPDNTEEYARQILDAIPADKEHRDDMSVTVAKISEV